MTEPEAYYHSLPDGRQLAYMEYGEPSGRPLFYFHGLPASRFEAGILDSAALALKLRVIAPERPGFGLSTRLVDRSLADYTDDVLALADALDIERFALFGMSAGGPHALACASRAASRVRRVAIVGPLGPCHLDWAVADLRAHGRTAFQLARHARPLLWPSYGLFTMLAFRYLPSVTLQAIHAFSPVTEQRALSKPAIRQRLVRSMSESMRQGPSPALQELALLGSNWDFDLKTISVPVRIWHGAADQVVPLSHAQYYAKVLPRAELTILENESHFSAPINHAAGILADLARTNS